MLLAFCRVHSIKSVRQLGRAELTISSLFCKIARDDADMLRTSVDMKRGAEAIAHNPICSLSSSCVATPHDIPVECGWNFLAAALQFVFPTYLPTTKCINAGATNYISPPQRGWPSEWHTPNSPDPKAAIQVVEAKQSGLDAPVSSGSCCRV